MIRRATRTVTAGTVQVIRVRFGDVLRVAWEEAPPGVGTDSDGGTVTVRGAFPAGSWALYVLTAAGIYRLAVESVPATPI